MRVESPALRLTVLLTDTGCYHHRPRCNEIVRRARKAGLAGAIVFHGVEGFGASSRIHAGQVRRLRDERTVRIEMVDEAGRIRAFLPELDEIVGHGLAVLEAVTVISFAGAQFRATAAAGSSRRDTG